MRHAENKITRHGQWNQGWMKLDKNVGIVVLFLLFPTKKAMWERKGLIPDHGCPPLQKSHSGGSLNWIPHIQSQERGNACLLTFISLIPYMALLRKQCCPPCAGFSHVS